MQIFTYLLSFIIGMLLGSFCTLAVYRIPLKQDILYKHSYCPNCNHKLNFLDLIPIFSYIFLKGKCRYCKTPIRIRYLIIEILFGFTFMLYTISIKFNILNININTIVFYVYSIIYITILFIIAGIDKEKIKIDTGVISYGLIFELLYIIYLCIYCNNIIYASRLIYFIIAIVIIKFVLKDYKKIDNKYIMQIVLLYIFLTIYSGLTLSSICFIITAIISLVINKFLIKNINKIPIGYILSITNIVIILISNFLKYYIIIN